MLLALFFGADAKVTALETAAVGDYVLIDASESVGTVSFDVPDPDAELFIRTDTKQALVRCPKEKRIRYCVTVKDGSGTSVCRDVIDFTGEVEVRPEPAPGPLPPSPPGPPPKLPDGRFKVSQASYDQAMLVNSGQRAGDAGLVLKQLEALKSKIASGAVNPSEIDEMKTAVRSATSSLPADVLRRWNGWGLWWGKSIVTGISGGTLKTAGDWVAFLDETIMGLKAVR